MPNSPTPAPDEFRLDPAGRKVFIGLLLGMLVSSISQTIVGPAIPRIVAELGGMEHYSWLATTAMLVTAVSVPIVGKLSDIYGRRRFFLAGLGTFMLGSALSGAATNFWFLVFARALQGLGMGALMPLSQTIIGDIIPPRYRGKYQGIMGAIFGFTSIAGPLAGGYITDHAGWRWLFYISLPVGLIAFWFVWRFFEPDQQRIDATIDYAGIGTLTIGLVALLAATSLGGTTWPWQSAQIIGLYILGAISIAVFIAVESKAKEPVIPLRLFTSSIFTLSNIANLTVSMLMFGILIYVPVFAQGVLGMSAGQSGAVLVPMSAAMVVTSIVIGGVVTRTGKYKAITLAGILLMAIGIWLLTLLSPQSSHLQLALFTVVIGIGLGACMQMFTLIVQNVVQRRDLGVATATTQFFRSTGGTVGVAVFGTVLTSHMGPAIAARMPAGQSNLPGGHLNAGAVLDPTALAKLPPIIAEAVRYGLSDALHDVFTAGIPLTIIALLAASFIKAVPLRTTNHTGPEAARDMLDTMSQTAEGGAVEPRYPTLNERTHERVLGLKIGLLVTQAALPEREFLRRAVEHIGEGDFNQGLAVLQSASTMLITEDSAEIMRNEPYAVELSKLTNRPGGVLGEELTSEIALAASRLEAHTAATKTEPPHAPQAEGVDIRKLRKAVDTVNAALLVDLSRASTTDLS
ncbi:Multidrug-efflux transporter 3 [Dermatophilus congolensis]|uniref:Multidrug-efflux transporter 3 n=1 Tax=Dermatophilus congolensis TaxID=1863 RepID=A0A239VEV4_9MICO|nr:DHA2 family efflux MFS transporter permease subunit [Dermatophilus congolensis]SNV20821.1 Multidrug-efflux transporter 3 [Dermatophilus congolensis]